jgi:hypothetical protein
MDIYSYRYSCQTWWGLVTTTGIRNLYTDSEIAPEIAAKNDAKKFNNTSDCDVQLLQRFKMTVTEVEPYPALAAQPIYRYNETNK